MIEFLFRNDAVIVAGLVRRKKWKYLRNLAGQAPPSRVLHFGRIRINTHHLPVARLSEQIDQVSGATADDQDLRVATSGDMRQVVGPVISAEGLIAAVDVSRSLPIGIERFQSRSQFG